jgi:eukaryotic-like serine/threonine-protein kinase
MPLIAGTRLGPYEIVSPLGAGGMGEVYRARDERLHRTVAIKVLPPHLSANPNVRVRFEREARIISSLQHGHICVLHDVGKQADVDFLVMEYLEGETLRQQLRRGAMPLRKAVECAQQIAQGLAAAHDKGIIHRDLKPENIFITRDGCVKILDFGIARLTPNESSGSSETLELTSQTDLGTVLGTVGYMSPEQVKGLTADHRSDFFSFGAILCEMLSGKPPFQKATAAETMTAILHEDPPALTQINPGVPYALQQVVERCLEKNPEQRFQSASDLAFALAALVGSGTFPTVTADTQKRHRWHFLLPVSAAIAALFIVLTVLFLRRAPEKPGLRLVASISPPPGGGFWANITQPTAISPNGEFLAMVAIRSSHTQLWVRRLDSLDAQPLAGTEGAANPFWSPDSRYIGFFADGKLKKVDVSGGAVSNICSAGIFNMGGAWSSQGVILFSVLPGKLQRVAAGGGAPEAVAGIEVEKDAFGPFWPSFLPDGKHFLYVEWRYHSPSVKDNFVWIGSLDSEKPRRLPITFTNAEYSGGYLLFNRDGDLLAQPFDLKHLELRGSAHPVARNVQYDTFFDNAAFTVSRDGILVFAPAGTGVNSELTWMDRAGKTLGVLGEPDHFEGQAISPDGTHVAVGVKRAGSRENIWIYDVQRGTRIPLAGNIAGSALYQPRWSADGKQLAYRTTVGKTAVMYVRASDGSGDAQQVGREIEGALTVDDWSPDSRYLAYVLTKFLGPDNWKDSLQVIPVTRDARPVFEIRDAEDARFSPDGRWLAYSDDSTGQVYVTRFPGLAGRIAVTSSGGSDPRWRADGQELFYVSNDQMLFSVQVRETAQEFRVLSSRPLFQIGLPSNVAFYDVTRDGNRFLVNVRTHKEESEPLTVDTNWLSSLQTH